MGGLRFVTTILGFLWMSEEEFGFDPTIIIADDKRFIEIKRDGTTERLIFDGVINEPFTLHRRPSNHLLESTPRRRPVTITHLLSRIHGNSWSAMTRAGYSVKRLARVWFILPGIIITKLFGYGMQMMISETTFGKGWMLRRPQTTDKINHDKHQAHAEVYQAYHTLVEAAAPLAQSGHLTRPMRPCRPTSDVVQNRRLNPVPTHYGVSSFATTEPLSTVRALEQLYSARSLTVLKGMSLCGAGLASYTGISLSTTS